MSLTPIMSSPAHDGIHNRLRLAIGHNHLCNQGNRLAHFVWFRCLMGATYKLRVNPTRQTDMPSWHVTHRRRTQCQTRRKRVS